MSIVDLTAIVTVVLAGIGTVVIPLLLQRRKRQSDASATEVVSWQGLTEAIQKERDDLRIQINDLRNQLNESDAATRRRVRDIEADWELRMFHAKARITDLENEIARLRRVALGEPGQRNGDPTP